MTAPGSCLEGDLLFVGVPLEKLEIHFSFGAAPKRGSRFLSLRMEITFKASSVLLNFPTTIRYHVSFGAAFLATTSIFFPFSDGSAL